MAEDIAAALGVSRAAVCQWIKRGREHGIEGLRRRPHPGAPAKLTGEQRAQIPVLLAQGAEAHGFRGDVGTAPRVAVVIERAFGVRYHPVHVGRLLRQRAGVGNAPSSGRRSATKRPSRVGMRSAGPRSKKGGRGRIHHCLGRRIRLLPLPHVIADRAPRGQTPILARAAHG